MAGATARNAGIEIVNKIKTMAQTMAVEFKTKILGQEDYITFDQAVAILRQELKYPEDRALHFVKRFDHNNDGRLSAAEFGQFRNKVEEAKVSLVPKFKEYDRDGNGYISLQEASVILQNKPFNFPADKVVVLLRKFDKDGNGKLDIDEFADFYAEAKATNDELTKRFDELDKDGNGVLSEHEVTTVIGEMMGVDRPRAIALMQMFDRNQDGSLDKTEFMQLWASIFGR